MKGLVEDAVQIVCIVAKGMGQQLAEDLSEAHGIYNASFNHARGIERASRIQSLGLGEQPEKDVFFLTVERSRADEVFEYLYFKAEIDQPHGGLIYQQAVPKTTILELPEVSQP
tara:strand:- start:1233 stop:1574 length:342 start_codon:yes stop_codon:yes gene_type:complete